MEKFVLSLNIFDIDILESIAIEKGFANARKMIDHEVATLKDRLPVNRIQCSKKQVKFKNNYDIPNEQADFYNTLACRHSTSISTIIGRYIIFPLLVERMMCPKEIEINMKFKKGAKRNIK